VKKLFLLLILACSNPTEPEWIQTEETICVNGICSKEKITCWTNTETGLINCNPEFDPEEP